MNPTSASSWARHSRTDRLPPQVSAKANYALASLNRGTLTVSIKNSKDAHAWNVFLDGKPVERWQIPFPSDVQRTGREQEHLTGRAPAADTVHFHLRGLAPDKDIKLEVQALSRGGQASAKTAVTVRSSPARKNTPKAMAIQPPTGNAKPHLLGKNLSVWAVPGLVKIDPLTSKSIHGDLNGMGDGHTANAVWNGKTIALHGARGETLSYQLVVKRNNKNTPVEDVSIAPGPLANGDSTISGKDFELFRNWYARVGKQPRWYPAFNLPLNPGVGFAIPDAKRGIAAQTNQTVLVDVWIPMDAKPGLHKGSVSVAQGGEKLSIPVTVEVHDFQLPDKLSFFVEFNTYNVPKNHLDFHRLAHQNRCVFNPWRYRPKAKGTGKGLTLDWAQYDKKVGPLLTGEAFKNNRRKTVPTPCLYLPFEDNWPINLTKENYHYKGPWVNFRGFQIKGNKRKNPKYKAAVDQLNQHYRTAPYLGDALQAAYTEGEAQAIRLFIEHFKQKGWQQTEMHQFYGGKKTHRIDYANNMWWCTDEPYHWEDWQALQFFNNLWTKTIREAGADPNLWMARGDISRPNWQGRVLDGVMQLQYGGFSDRRHNLRMRWLHENTGVITRDYGGLGSPSMSYTQAGSNVLHLWLSGASGFLPWQTVGREGSLDRNTTTTLFVDGKRFGLPVVADMRLKGFRQGQQLIEYCELLARKKKLSREQIRAFITQLFPVGLLHTGQNVDNADAKKATTLVAWKVSELRRQMAKLISQ